MDYPFAEDARAKLSSIREEIDGRGLDVAVYTPETLSYPYSFSDPEETVRKRTVDYFSMAMAVAGESLEDYFEAFGADGIRLIHVADTCHYILGDGELPLKGYVRTLEEYGYTGIVDLGVNGSIYWDDPHKPIERSVEWLWENLGR